MLEKYSFKTEDAVGIADTIREVGKIEGELIWPEGWKAAIRGIKDGADLNFEVVGGDTVPENPKENTIWIETSTEITSWVFDFTEPNELAEGMVWFILAEFSNVSFNALVKNMLIVAPAKCMQYLKGAWEPMHAATYINDGWHDWFDGTLFDNGNQYNYVTGGWEHLNATQWGHIAQGTVNIGDSIELSTASAQSAHAAPANMIDFRGWDTINISVSSMGQLAWNPMITSRKSGGNIEESAVATYTISAAGTYSFPLGDAAKGMYYLIFGVANGRSATITKVWLSKGVS